MHALSAFQYLNELAAEEAFSIAWTFIQNTHDVADAFAAQAFIANEIARQLERGERHKILLANRAIAAYERAHSDDLDHLLALGEISR